MVFALASEVYKAMAKKKIIFLKFLSIAGLFALLFLGGAGVANAAALRLNPGIGSVLVGGTFDLSVILDTKGVSVNFLEVELFFPSDKLQLASPSVGKSIIQFWPTPPVFSNQEGRVYFAGGAPSPGINVSDGLVLTLTFRAISAGEGEIRFGGKTSVLANDGAGTELLNQKSSSFLKISFPPPLGPAITSPTHSDQERWYKENNAIFIWRKSVSGEAYSFAIDRDPAGVPDTVAEGTDATVSFADLESGIWYFHLREKANGVWGGASAYTVKIDNEPLASFRINVSPGARTSNRSPILRFFTTDALAGLDHWEMKIIRLSSQEAAQALFFEVSSPYQAVNLESGRHQIVVRAFDQAKNARDETTVVTILGAGSWFFDSEGVDLYFMFLPWRFVALAAGAAFIIFLFAVARLWFRHRHHVRHAFREDIQKLFGFIKKSKKQKM